MITPAESGVGESIVSADSPGLEKGRQAAPTPHQSMHRREAVSARHQQLQQQQQPIPTMAMMMQPRQQHPIMDAGGRSEPRRKKSIGGGGGGNHCITPTGDLTEDKVRVWWLSSV